MSSHFEPKVTECWSCPAVLGSGRPAAGPSHNISPEMRNHYRKTILMWREDYDALIKERDDLRKRCRYNLDPGAQITCWDEYESLRARYDAMRKELEELREWRKAVKGGYRGV
jgi:hypothetical protein